MLKRMHVLFSGSVQGVGFRYAAMSSANSFALKGFVKNLEDGKVEFMAEGEEKDLKGFLETMREKMNYCHYSERVSWFDPTGEFSRFDIAF